MKKGIFCAFLGLVFVAGVIGQTVTGSGQGSANSSAGVSKQNGALTIASGTEIAGELQKSLDVGSAKVGDQVVLKTKKAIKQNGEVVVEKGAKLFGRVTEVKERAKGDATSRIGVLFDTLKQGDITMPVRASIVSVVNVAARAAMDTDVWADGGASSRTSTSAQSSGGGGLLGGVTQTAGGVVNTATSTVGAVANTATNTAGGVANTAGSTVGSTVNSVGRIEVAQSTEASASGSSTLSLNGGNLKLEKGTTFNVALSSTANAGN